MEKGPVTQAYAANLELLSVLNDSLATEIGCVLRYKAHHYGAKGLNAEPIAAEFLEHAHEEQVHADRLAERIDQLGGTPELNPDTLMPRSHTEYNTPEALREMIKEDLTGRSTNSPVGWRVVIADHRSEGDHEPHREAVAVPPVPVGHSPHRAR